MLTYMVTLILRHDQNNVGIWMNEWFPKEGYGYFLAFIYVVLLPLPSVYYFVLGVRGSTAKQPWEQDVQGTFQNPLSPDTYDMDSRKAVDERGARTTLPAFSHAKLAKMSRLSNEMTAEISRLSHQNDQLSAENEKLRFSLISSGGDVGDLGESVTEVTSMTQNKGRNKTASDQVAVVDPHAAQIAMMKTILADESLSEENREVAKGVLDARVSSSLELSKRQLGVQHRGNVANITAAEWSAHLDSVKKRDAGGFARSQGAREGLRAWLGELRLMGHEQAFVDVGGPDVALDDLQFCRQEDVDAIAKGMSYLEAQRFNQAMERLKSDTTQAGELNY
jgi:hypothetical protein